MASVHIHCPLWQSAVAVGRTRKAVTDFVVTFFCSHAPHEARKQNEDSPFHSPICLKGTNRGKSLPAEEPLVPLSI
jgi:hypothetical protein